MHLLIRKDFANERCFLFFNFLMSVSSPSFSSRWPDPNSSVLSKIYFGVPLVELFKWLDVRDKLLGENYKERDIAAALTLARDCKHPDAVWLTSLFEGKDDSTKEDARNIFLSFESDARALCFAWLLTENRWKDLTLLRRVSEMGNAFACSTLCEQVVFGNEEETFRLAQLAAALHERDGFYWLGRCFRDGVGCDEDLILAKENLLIAAEFGNVRAAEDFGRLLGECDPVRWLWWGRAALFGSPFSFLCSFSNQVEKFFSGSGNATVVFLIGLALKGNIDVVEEEIFGDDDYFDFLSGPANQAVSFHDSQIKSARLAVDTWALVATRLHLIKDMRVLIGKMIWEGRFEANYKI